MTAEIDAFHTIDVSRHAYALQSAGRSVIHMEFGQPSTGAPRAAIAAAREALDTDPLGYWESDALKRRISEHYRQSHGVDIRPERIILTCGASPALILALTTAFAPGQTIATARPGYVAYRNNLRALHMKVLEIECGAAQRFRLSADAIAALDPVPDGLVIASPANPTGTIIAPDEMARIARLCADRNIHVISDEIYHGLSFGEPAHSMLQYLDDAFVVNSFSKYFCMTGWRLGWLVVPETHVAPARARMGNMFLTPPSLSQHAGLAAFECAQELDGRVETYRRNRELLLDALPALGLDAIAPPDGAFYIYASVAHLGEDSLGLCMKLLDETGVATAPGIDFDPVDGRHFMRMSFAVETPQIEEAIVRMKSWFPAQPRLKAAGG
ncbi:pyridoxal phosphate-dependent aminotransferase [Sphingomonas colocasiae]|uniref:aspartate transaminase n=1 Tax=Sphingomonas colocasiae TaxID=1848973 RepID=A0ABS7PXW1_9SPHN|nr:aminotransferase class I/II-fold pyridoxal phosphate-dependent enzyme [Sphingomonas colocasiae]MBY8826197.1 aminotransferase class I/II-fold pyridoxal phosphate-dependent enzyme [Sphingomonas colocasiae]